MLNNDKSEITRNPVTAGTHDSDYTQTGSQVSSQETILVREGKKIVRRFTPAGGVCSPPADPAACI